MNETPWWAVIVVILATVGNAAIIVGMFSARSGPKDRVKIAEGESDET